MTTVPMRGAVLVGVLLSLAFAAGPVNRSLAGQSRPPEQPATAVIVGRVLEAGSTRPVEEAVVTLSGPGIDRRVMVDGQGRFAFTNLPAGKYELTADQFGFVRGAFGRLRPDGAGAVLELADGQRFLDASLLMWRFASITGRVVDDAGEPIARITVRALLRTIEAGRVALVPIPSQSATTDDRGVYRLAKLAPGDYAVAVPARISTFPVDVVRDATRSGVSFGVRETPSLGDYGTLQIGNQVMTTMSNAPIPPAPSADGRLVVFQTTYFPAASSVTDATVMPLAAGEERTAVDIQLTAVSASSVSGRIVGPDGPVGLTPFRLVRAGGEASYETSDFETATGLTDADGRFTLLGVPRGRYDIRLGPGTIPATGTGPGAKPVLVASAPVTLGDGGIANVQVVAHSIATLNGRVEMRNGLSVPPTALLLMVQALDAGPVRAMNPRVDKTYAFSTQILPGRYLLAAYANGARCGSVSVNGTDVGDSLVAVEYEDVNVVFTCSSGSQRVTGLVRDDNGSADPRTQVVLFSADRRHWTGNDYRPLRLRSVRADANGRFTMADFPPGEYFIAAVPEASGDAWRDPKILDTLSRSAARITVVVGETRAVDLTTVNIK